MNDTWTPVEDSPTFGFRPDDVKSDEGKVYWSDYGKAAWNNVKQPRGPLGAVNYVTAS